MDTNKLTQSKCWTCSQETAWGAVQGQMGQMTQTSCYKISKSWGWSHSVVTLVNTVLHIWKLLKEVLKMFFKWKKCNYGDRCYPDLLGSLGNIQKHWIIMYLETNLMLYINYILEKEQAALEILAEKLREGETLRRQTHTNKKMERLKLLSRAISNSARPEGENQCGSKSNKKSTDKWKSKKKRVWGRNC